MPTIAESKHPEQTERRLQAVKEFVEAPRLSVSASIDVLRARLFGLGLRGQDLLSEVRLAQECRLERERVNTVRIHKPLFGGFPVHWATGYLGKVTWTEEPSEAGRYTLQEAALLREQIQERDPGIVVEITTKEVNYESNSH